MRHRIVAHIRNRIGRGLLIVLPLLITLWLLAILFNIVQQNLTPVVLALLRLLRVPGWDHAVAQIAAPVVGVVLTAAVVYAIGLLAGNLVGRRLLALVESGILRVPVVKAIYGAARQLLDAFRATGSRAFSQVVLVEYPRRGVWTVGFVTRERPYDSGGVLGRERSVPVFLPTTPNPTSGWLILVAPEDLWILDLPIEEAVKLIVSGGIVGPEDLRGRMRPWSEGAGAVDVPGGEGAGGADRSR